MSNLSELLKSKRISLNKSINEVSQKTKIREQFIEIIEEGKFSELPSYLHAYGFVKKYSDYLGFSYDEEIKKLFDIEYPKDEIDLHLAQGTKNILDKKYNEGLSKNNNDLWFKVAIVSVVLFLLYFGYNYYRKIDRSKPIRVMNQNTEISKNLPPSIKTPKVEEPVVIEDNTVTYKSLLEASGNLEASYDNESLMISNDEIVDNDSQVIIKPTEKFVVLTFTETCWFKFIPDDNVSLVQDLTAPVGLTKKFAFYDNFTLEIGNAAALTIRYQDQRFTNFGRKGIVLKNLKYKVDEDGNLVRVDN